MAVEVPALPSHIFNRALYDSLHDLWFSSLAPDATAPSLDQMKRWFGFDISEAEKEAFDDQCRAVAGPALETLGGWRLPLFESYEVERREAAAIAEPLWNAVYEKTADEEVKGMDKTYVARALILLLDQMSRNILRDDQAKIYAHFDRIAYSLSICMTSASHTSSNLASIDRQGSDAGNPTRRMWFYMPLMHSEALKDHDAFRVIVSGLGEDSAARGDAAALKYFDLTLSAEAKHRDILEKFGRYPYRNEWLQRDTTKLEQQWIESGGDTFGARAKPGSKEPVQVT